MGPNLRQQPPGSERDEFSKAAGTASLSDSECTGRLTAGVRQPETANCSVQCDCRWQCQPEWQPDSESESPPEVLGGSHCHWHFNTASGQ